MYIVGLLAGKWSNDKKFQILSQMVLLPIPGIFLNSTWFHPDILMSTFVLSSVILFHNSKLVFKKFGLVLFGLALCTKIQAILFMPIIGLIYLTQNKHQNYLSIFQGIIKLVTVPSIIYIIGNPYILHPKGFSAWLSAFLYNINSNKTNHNTNINLSYIDRLEWGLFKFYLPAFIFTIIVLFSILNIIKKLIKKEFSLDFYISVTFLSQILYLVTQVNKGWHHYYLTSVLAAIILISFFASRLKNNGNFMLIMLMIAFSSSFKDFWLQEVKNRIDLTVSSDNTRYQYRSSIVRLGDTEEYTDELAEMTRLLNLSDTAFLIPAFLPFSDTMITNKSGLPTPIFKDIADHIEQLSSWHDHLRSVVIIRPIGSNLLSSNQDYESVLNKKFAKFFNENNKLDISKGINFEMVKVNLN